MIILFDYLLLGIDGNWCLYLWVIFLLMVCNWVILVVVDERVRVVFVCLRLKLFDEVLVEVVVVLDMLDVVFK